MSEIRCPVCDQPIASKNAPTMPFCSARCKQIDLGRWLSERYGMPFERPYDPDAPDEPEDTTED